MIHPITSFEQFEATPEAIELMRSTPGFYIGSKVGSEGQVMLVVTKQGKIFSMVTDRELDPSRFIDGDLLTGPLKLETEMQTRPEGPTLEDVANFAKVAHFRQTRRDGVTPYINHPAAVAKMVEGDEHAEMTAWLHDVMEDTNVRAEDLFMMGVPGEVVQALKYLTKREDEPYDLYIDTINRNLLARKVKIADILHNLSDDPTDKQKEKYGRALDILEYDPRNGDPQPPTQPQHDHE